MTLAMKDVCVPVAYCDIATSCRSVLACRMIEGGLPAAPVCEDVSILNKKWLVKNKCKCPQVILAGFPCQGFSVIGKRSGFADQRSNLFEHVIRLCDELRLPMLFLENSPNIIHEGLEVMQSALSKRGYQLDWTIMSANEVGAPQKRSRWYGVAHTSRHNALLRKMMSTPVFQDWGREPSRMILKCELSHTTRLFMLGNAVVPQAARAAFHRIVTGKTVETVPATRPLCLDPQAFKGKSLRSPSSTVIRKILWATPLATSTTASQILTERNSRLLPNQLRFERDTPDNLRLGWMNPRFVEWLMGYPKGWTRGCS